MGICRAKARASLNSNSNTFFGQLHHYENAGVDGLKGRLQELGRTEGNRSPVFQVAENTESLQAVLFQTGGEPFDERPVVSARRLLESKLGLQRAGRHKA